MTAEQRAYTATKAALESLEAERDAALLPMIKTALDVEPQQVVLG
jgi:hypothetical protein